MRVEDLLREEAALQALITDLQDRVEWLRSASRDKFGVVTEKRIVIVMDSYAVSNVTFGSFCSAVAALVREQIIEIEAFNVMRWVQYQIICFLQYFSSSDYTVM